MSARPYHLCVASAPCWMAAVGLNVRRSTRLSHKKKLNYVDLNGGETKMSDQDIDVDILDLDMEGASMSDWIGLDLFNDDTRPSGHISRPTQVNVSQSCFHSLNNYSSLIIL